MKKVAIIQPNYIPWIGYFDVIQHVDEFILLDDVQYTKRDWRNRNIIRTNLGASWLTIPVQTKNKFDQLIKDVLVEGDKWRDKHYKTLLHQYGRESGFQEFGDQFEALYKKDYVRLIDVLHDFLLLSLKILEIDTPIRLSSEFNTTGTKTEKLLALCEATEATCYVSGPKAKAYLVPKDFESRNIAVEWFEYQNGEELEPNLDESAVNIVPDIENLSILDLIFRNGKEVKKALQKA